MDNFECPYSVSEKPGRKVQKEPNEVDITVEVLIIGAFRSLKVLQPKLTESMLITSPTFNETWEAYIPIIFVY